MLLNRNNLFIKKMELKNEIRNRFEGKIIATRGIGSGVIAGRCITIEGNSCILSEAFFLREWKYKNSFGSMHSLSTGDIIPGGQIAKIARDIIITDLANAVVCPDDFLEKLEKLAN